LFLDDLKKLVEKSVGQAKSTSRRLPLDLSVYGIPAQQPRQLGEVQRRAARLIA